METAVSGQAAAYDPEEIRLAELLAVVEELDSAKPCDFCALRIALVALTESGFSDRTLSDNWCMLEFVLDTVSARANAVTHAAELRVCAAFIRAAANLDTGSTLEVSEFQALLVLMATNPAVLSVQTDCLFALADFLSLSAENTRAGAPAFGTVFFALRDHGAALVSAAGPALNRVLLSATTFLSARLVTEPKDYVATVGAIALVLAFSKDAGAVVLALEVLSFCYCNGSEALLALEPYKLELLASSDMLLLSLELCLKTHSADLGVVVELVATLTHLAAVSYHRLQDHPRADDFAFAISERVMRILVANAGNKKLQCLGCHVLCVLFSGGAFSRYKLLNKSAVHSAISAGAHMAIAAALRSHHSDELAFTSAAHLFSCFFNSGEVDTAPYTDFVQICVEALERLVLDPDITTARANAMANGAILLGALFAVSPECKARGRQVGAAKTLAAVHTILAQRTDLCDEMKAMAFFARQLLDYEESASLQSNLASAGAGRRSQPQHRSKAPLSASELAAATAAADAAAAALLAEEEAEKAAKAPASAAQGSPSQRRRRKKLGGGASAEPDELDAATLAAPMPVMPPVAGAGASAEPSASAKRRQRRIAAKAASHHPPAARPTSPVAAPSPEPALSDAEEQAQPEAPEEPLEPAPLPVEIPPPPAPILAAEPAVEDEAACLRRQLEALQLERNALKLKTAALELEKNAMEREKRAHESERESQLCTVCLDAPRSHVLFPCHHHCLCGSLECFRMLGTPPLCPICRSAVAQARQIY